MRPLKRRGRLAAHKVPNFIRHTVFELIGLHVKGKTFKIYAHVRWAILNGERKLQKRLSTVLGVSVYFLRISGSSVLPSR